MRPSGHDPLPLLIVEDDPGRCALDRGALSASGYAVTEAPSLAQARRRIAERPYALLLLDLRLPDGDGLEALAAARARDDHAVAVVRFGCSSEAAAVAALRAGAHDALVKPCSSEALLARLGRARERYLLSRSLAERTAELARGAAQLKAVEEQRARFLEDLAHELRNPLCVVLGYAGYLAETLEGLALPDEALRSLGTLNRNALYLRELVERLMDAARLDGGKIILRREPFPAAEAVEEALEALRLPAREKGVHLRAAPPASGALVLADRVRLRQVLSNLAGNALKFTPPGGLISVDARPEGQAVRFTVADTGCGMAEEEAAKVFDRFYQAGTPLEQKEGLGLGLHIAQALVELHGGRLWVESSPGAGARFHFTIPGPPPRPATQAKGEPRIAESRR